MAIYTIVVTSPPHQNKTATVIELAHALIDENHEINGIFFYQDGVLNASATLAMPNDEFQACKAFVELNQKHNIPLHLCITAAEKRGLTDERERLNIHTAFTISGLGEMVELSTVADKVIQL